MNFNILSLDQGTTSSRAIVFATDGTIVSKAQYDFRQLYPNPGWVEHDPFDILQSQYSAVRDAVCACSEPISCIGITNQRETVVVWEKSSGKPVYNAIVWQCRRTSSICESLCSIGYSDEIKQKTGLNIDPYFSATKIKWILNNIPNGLSRAKNGELLCGTIDTWLIWNLTAKKVHATDVSNASRTMLFNINTLKWDESICALLDIPICMLPTVKNTADDYGVIAPNSLLPPSIYGLHIRSAVGDQQAALFGQCCFDIGDVKNTYGTGCFALMNIGDKPSLDSKGLLTTVAWRLFGKTVYAIEGSVFNAGSSIQWLRDELGIIKTAHECDILAESVPNTAGVMFISAFTGLGAPYWDMYARGAMLGLTRGTTKAHICRAVLQGIAMQVCDLITAIEDCCGKKIASLRVDGGASVSDFMMQFQSDILGTVIDRPFTVETTAMGAAFLACIGEGIFSSYDKIRTLRKTEMLFPPEIDDIARSQYKSEWTCAINRIRSKI